MIPKRRHETRISQDALRLFAYLDGEMDVEERRAFESSVSGDSGLASDVAAFRRLFTALEGLGLLTPSADFKVRVLARLHTRPSLRARLKDWMAGGRIRGPAANPLLAHLEGELTPRQSRALAAFLSRDPEAAEASRAWKTLLERLDLVPRLEPSPGFANRVMARLAGAPAHARQPARASLRRLAGMWPRRRERLAAVSGVAFGPTAVLAATGYMILSNPLVTLSNVLSYVWAKGPGLLAAWGERIFGGALESGALGGTYQLVRGLNMSGSAVVLGLTVFAGLTLLSGWILYRNLIKVTPAVERRYVAA